MIGDSSVGKTSLVVRYDEDTFSTKYMTTIGVDYRDKFVTIDDQNVKLQIWDTAGQERFRSLTANFFGKADGFVVCYDVASSSFDHVRSWVGDINRHKRGEVDVALCGCKCDVPADKRQVPEADAALADEYGVDHYEASAKTNVNVATAFEELAAKIVRRKLQTAASSDAGAPGGGANLVISPDDAKPKKCACG
ncbi:GTPase [Aureococcus anophagefferens]|nr:GTPase [Aureococcus anophagefferens]